MRIQLVVAGLAVGLGVAHGAPQDDGPGADSVRRLALGMRAARTGMPAGSAVIEHVETLAPASVALINWQSERARVQPGPDGSNTKHHSARWYRHAPRLAVYVDRLDRPTGAEKVYTQSERLCSDGERALTLSIVAGVGGGADAEGPTLARQGTIQPTDAALPAGVWLMQPWADVGYLAYYARCFGEPAPLDELLIDDDPTHAGVSVEYVGVEAVQGSPCEHLRVTDQTAYRRDFWIDSEHGYLIRGAVLSQDIQGELVTIVQETVPEVWQTDGVWLPRSLERLSRFTRPAAGIRTLVGEYRLEVRGGLALFPPNRELTTIVSAQFHEAPGPELFELGWPEGTVIHDTVRQEHRVAYLLAPDEEVIVREMRAEQ